MVTISVKVPYLYSPISAASQKPCLICIQGHGADLCIAMTTSKLFDFLPSFYHPKGHSRPHIRADYLFQERIVKDTTDCLQMALHPLAGFIFHGQQGKLIIEGDKKSSVGFIKVEKAPEVLTFGERASYPLNGQLVLNIPESQNLA